ncbi:NeuD/PglB/VioB family sugar acetyltransferase [Nostocoides veronense]|uniref:Acetyltransferase n=1 Tax=Nostocoides veronense TaxID=330836 RepID=A0ABP4XMY4_9MICO
MEDLVIVGAGGFGRETLDLVMALNQAQEKWSVLGVVDDSPSPANLERLARRGVPHLGGIADIPRAVAVAVAVGRPRARRAIVDELAGGGHRYPALIHPSAVVGTRFQHGEGLIVLGGVSIGTNVEIGAHVHLNAHAVVGHDTRLLNHVSVNPNATVSGECVVGPLTLLGASSTVLQQITVGEDVTIGAGAVVTRDVTSGVTAKGVPAR